MSFDLTQTEDQRQILDAAQTMLDTWYPVDRLRDTTASDPLAPLAEFGAFALAVPEEHGGAGFDVVDEALLHTALGRHLVTPSAVTTALAVRLSLEEGEMDRAAQLAAGELTACAGVESKDGALLLEPEGADFAVLRSAGGLQMIALAGLSTVPQTAMGLGRPMARLTAVPDSNPKGLDQIALISDLLVSAQLLGVAEGARDLAVSYAGIREQFGRPIGSFQAIKHHCANMTLGAEMISAQLDMAAIALRDGRDDAAFQISALARLAPQVALKNARIGIQIHGGIGFSAEADAQLYLKHVHALRSLLPDGDFLAMSSPMAALQEA